MNAMPTLPPEHTIDLHVQQVRHQGYTLVHNALTPEQVRRYRTRFEELLPKHGELPTAAKPDTPSRDINRLWEVDPMYEDLMDLPTVWPIVERITGGDAKLLGGAIGNYMPPRSPARVPWHRDGPYLRLTYLLTDVNDNGPTAVIPGSHRDDEGPPPWYSDNGNPRYVPGMVRITAPAGTCMINDTNIWHTSTPNVTDDPRELVWIVFTKQAGEDTGFLNLRNTDAFVQRQTKPVRRMLVGRK